MTTQGYRVATDDLHQIATEIADINNALRSMRSLIADQLPGDHDLGVPELLAVFNTLTTWAEGHLDDLGKGLSQTADDVRASAESYLSTDNDVAERLASLLDELPSSSDGPMDTSQPGGSRIASRLLQAPAGEQDDPGK